MSKIFEAIKEDQEAANKKAAELIGKPAAEQVEQVEQSKTGKGKAKN